MTKPPQLPFPDNTDSVDVPADKPPAQRYTEVWEWVEGWFVPHIRRRMNPTAGKGLCWDPAWWHYPEVVSRFFALHAAWEEATAADAPASASAMSTWWTSHLEPHLRVIFDSDSGPMSLAAAGEPFAGHPPLQTVPVPDEVKQHYDLHPNAALHALEPGFPDVWDWIEGWFVKVIRRRVQAGKGLSWDPRWWQYPEVVVRFQALHAAWEFARVSESASAMSVWWVSHLEPQLRVIYDGETGPMSLAGSDPTFAGHAPLGSTPVPEPIKRLLARKD